MSFDGTKESCPNYNSETNELYMNYVTFIQGSTWSYDRQVMNDPSYGKADFNKTCFNICETKNDDGSDKGPTYIDRNMMCRGCLDIPDDQNDSNDPSIGSRPYLINDGKYEMCNVPGDIESGSVTDTSNIETNRIWFSRQQDANLLGISQDRINWVLANDDTNMEGRRILNYWSEAQRGMTNQEILRLIGNRTAGTMEYTLPEKYMKREYIGTVRGSDGDLGVEVFDFQKVRRDINEGRGSVVNCSDISWLDPVTGQPIGPECPNGKFGPNDIIPEEVEDFIIEMLDSEALSSIDTDGLSDFSSLLSGLQYDSTFEACVNDKLNTGSDDFEAQERISKYTSIKEFRSKDINYLKKKLRKIITMETNEVNECMNLLNLGKSLCQTGVADKTLMIGSLIFKIIGNDKIDIMESSNDEKYKMNKLIDEIGPLIPQAVKNIIHVSKEYETRVCNTPSNTTLLLERLYTDLYDKQTNVTLDISPYIDFDSLINTKGHWHFIKKITVLVVFAFLFMHATNLVVAFLSRGQSAPKI
jgi:hypothetical protein